MVSLIRLLSASVPLELHYVIIARVRCRYMNTHARFIQRRINSPWTIDCSVAQE